MNGTTEAGGIGTYGERTLHAALKRYFEPDTSKHEIKYKGYIADILREGEIIEIQTRGLYRLRRKLSVMLEEMRVTLVYPVTRRKWLVWVDPETGEAVSKRRSPKVGRCCDALFELYGVRELLTNPSLRLRVVMTDVEEYRRLDGWSKNKKRGSTRSERIPVEIGEIIEIDRPEDFEKLLPDGLESEFTADDFHRAGGMSLKGAQTALNVLGYVGAVERVGKKGRAYLWRVRQVSDSVETSCS